MDPEETPRNPFKDTGERDYDGSEGKAPTGP